MKGTESKDCHANHAGDALIAIMSQKKSTTIYSRIMYAKQKAQYVKGFGSYERHTDNDSS